MLKNKFFRKLVSAACFTAVTMVSTIGAAPVFAASDDAVIEEASDDTIVVEASAEEADAAAEEADTEADVALEDETVEELDSVTDASDNEAKAALYNVVLVGDSTVCEYTDAGDISRYYRRYGWGSAEVLSKYIDPSKYNIKNHARSGRSSLYFEEGYWTAAFDDLEAGDILVIGFGHNDEKTENIGTGTWPTGDYTKDAGEGMPGFEKTLYDRYIKPARDKGASVILCTPIVRRNKSGLTAKDIHETNNKKETSYTVNGVSHDFDYRKAIVDLGKAVNCPVVDLTTLTKEQYNTLTPEQTACFHASQGITHLMADGSVDEEMVDNTHLNIYGAYNVAYMFADAVSKCDDASIADLKAAVSTSYGMPKKEDVLVKNPSFKETPYSAPTTKSTLWTPYKKVKADFYGSVFGILGGQSKVAKANFTLEPVANGVHMVGKGYGKTTVSQDGIAMYYHQIPATASFTLTAKATVNSFDDKSDQSGFGLMARDDMYIDKNMASLKSDYVVAGTMSGKMASACYARKGGILNGEADAEGKHELFKELTTPVKAGETYDLKIESTSEGYAVTFGDEGTRVAGFDYALQGVDKSNVYVGMFVSRTADITFSDIKLVVNGEELTSSFLPDIAAVGNARVDAMSSVSTDPVNINVLQTKDDTVKLTETYIKSKLKSVNLNTASVFEGKVTVNAGSKVNITGNVELKGKNATVFTVDTESIKAVSGNTLDDKTKAKIAKSVNKKGVIAPKVLKVNGETPDYSFDVVFKDTNEKEHRITVNVRNIDISCYKATTLAATAGNSMDIVFANGDDIVSTAWYVGAEKKPLKPNASTQVAKGKNEAFATVKLSEDASKLIVTATGKGAGAIKVTAVVNGKKYSTAIKVVDK